MFLSLGRVYNNLVQCKIIFSWYPSFTWSIRDALCLKSIVVVGKNVRYSHLSSYSLAGLALGPAEISPSVQAAGEAWPSCLQSKNHCWNSETYIWLDWVPKHFKGFVPIFHKCFYVKTYWDEFFILKIKYSLVHKLRTSFGIRKD